MCVYNIITGAAWRKAKIWDLKNYMDRVQFQSPEGTHGTPGSTKKKEAYSIKGQGTGTCIRRGNHL